MVRKFSAGGVVYKKEGGEILWLLMQPKPSKEFPSTRFQFPKGEIDRGEKGVNTAVREVAEETGITGKTVQKIGDSKYFFSQGGERIFKIVSFYLLEYISGNPQPDGIETSEVFWLPFEAAKKKLTFSSDKQILQKARDCLEKY